MKLNTKAKLFTALIWITNQRWLPSIIRHAAAEELHRNINLTFGKYYS